MVLCAIFKRCHCKAAGWVRSIVFLGFYLAFVWTLGMSWKVARKKQLLTPFSKGLFKRNMPICLQVFVCAADLLAEAPQTPSWSFHPFVRTAENQGPGLVRNLVFQWGPGGRKLSVLAQEILLRLPEKRSKGRRPFCAYYINGWGKMPDLFSIWDQYEPIRNLQLLLGGGVSRARLSCKEHPGNFLCLSYAAARRENESCHGNVAGAGRVARLHEHDKLSGQVRSRFE